MPFQGVLIIQKTIQQIFWDTLYNLYPPLSGYNSNHASCINTLSIHDYNLLCLAHLKLFSSQFDLDTAAIQQSPSLLNFMSVKEANILKQFRTAARIFLSQIRNCRAILTFRNLFSPEYFTNKTFYFLFFARFEILTTHVFCVSYGKIVMFNSKMIFVTLPMIVYTRTLLTTSSKMLNPGLNHHWQLCLILCWAFLET